MPLDNDTLTREDAPVGFLQQAVFWIAACLVLIYGLWTDHLRGSEDRWAEIARGMLQTGDWFHPAVNGQIYFDKPLLSYWPIVLLAKITGVLDEFIVRLPSALSALAALYSTRYLGRKLFDNRTGLAAGWISLSCLGFLAIARTASADMMNMTAVVMAVGWFFYCKDKAGFWHYLLFYVICFGGALTKGLPALVIPPLLVLSYAIVDRSLKKHVNIPHAAALATGLALYVSTFFVAAYTPMPEGYLLPWDRLSGLELVWRENIVRVFEPFDHVEPFYIYFIHVPRIFAPWALLMVAAAIAVASYWRIGGKSTRWLLIANAIIFIMFTSSGSRRWYYIMPIVPFMAVLIGRYMTGEVAYKWREGMSRVYFWLMLALCALIIFSPLALYLLPRTGSFAILEHAGQVPAVIFYAMPVAAVAAAAMLLANRDVTAKITALPADWAGTVLAATILLGAAFAVVIPEIGRLRTAKPFSLEVKELVAGVNPKDIAFYPRTNPRITFYLNLDSPTSITGTPEALREFASRPGGPRYLIARDNRGVFDELLQAIPDLPLTSPLLEEDDRLLEKPGKPKTHIWRLPARE